MSTGEAEELDSTTEADQDSLVETVSKQNKFFYNPKFIYSTQEPTSYLRE